MLKEFGDLKVGDWIQGPIGADGKRGDSVQVTQVYEKHIPDTMFEVETEDGSIVRVSGNHLWYVESEIDQNYHPQRMKEAKDLFKKLDAKIVAKLLSIAENDLDDYETSMIDMIALLDYNPVYAEGSDMQTIMDVQDQGKSKGKAHMVSPMSFLSQDDQKLVRRRDAAIARIAESIGHIAENSTTYEDTYSGEVLTHGTVRMYDAQKFAQQILAATGVRKFKKRWPLTVGKVVTTERMFELMDADEEGFARSSIELYIPNSSDK